MADLHQPPLVLQPGGLLGNARLIGSLRLWAICRLERVAAEAIQQVH